MRNTVTFLLNGKVERVADIAPTTTLLQWLRRQRQLTGTKEGCAEGDCGACTVVVGRLDGDSVRHDAINACIQLMPMLDGASVTTVEGVAAGNGDLHPCQQALVEMHGSQCGFCTPGFVMSLYAMYLGTVDVPSDAAIDGALAGNLCRCTGYGPIVAAAKRMFALPRPVGEDAGREREQRLLHEIAHAETLCIDGADRRMFVPATEDELARLYLDHPDAVLVAGATDVGLWVTKRDRPLPTTIHVGRVAMQAGSGVADQVWLSATATHAQAARAIGDRLPALGELWRRFAGAQVRNAGTVGGNIANGSPIGDLPPALIALDAKLHLRRGDEQRVLPLEDFFVAYGKQDRRPGEYVRGVSLALPATVREDFACHKVSKRFDDDISAVCGAFNIRVDAGVVTAARIAFGGMAGVPQRAKAVEAALVGRSWTRATVDAALAAFETDFVPISDARASAQYRMAVAKNLLVRTFIERTQPSVATRLAGAALLADG